MQLVSFACSYDTDEIFQYQKWACSWHTYRLFEIYQTHVSGEYKRQTSGWSQEKLPPTQGCFNQPKCSHFMFSREELHTHSLKLVHYHGRRCVVTTLRPSFVSLAENNATGLPRAILVNILSCFVVSWLPKSHFLKQKQPSMIIP
jgi:hypothetical protein